VASSQHQGMASELDDSCLVKKTFYLPSLHLTPQLRVAHWIFINIFGIAKIWSLATIITSYMIV